MCEEMRINMRLAISSSYLTIITIMLVITHCSVINKNYRDMEINSNINDAFSYAIDKSYYEFAYSDSDNLSKDTILHNTMLTFNEAFRKSISSDGNFTIKLLYADVDNMILDIMITDEYDYGFMSMKGKVSCERTVKLN